MKFARRTLDNLKEDLSNFREDGENIKHAKFFKNVIDEPLFDVPIDQVCSHKISIYLDREINDKFSYFKILYFRYLYQASIYLLEHT